MEETNIGSKYWLFYFVEVTPVDVFGSGDIGYVVSSFNSCKQRGLKRMKDDGDWYLRSGVAPRCSTNNKKLTGVTSFT